jgi:biopolymer transport protein ExbD
VLLLYFIQTWNFALTESQLDISVPSAKEGSEAPRAVGQMIVNVGATGEILVNRRSLTPDELKEILVKLSKDYPDQAVVLRGDQQASYKHIVQVLDVCRAANIWNVAFATAKEKVEP